MYIRYKVSDGKVIYVGEQKPINEEDGTYAVVECDLPYDAAFVKYYTYNSKLIPHYLTPQEETALKNQSRIAQLKRILIATDYIAIKYSEGVLTTEEYAATKQLRQDCRDEINNLEVLV